MRNCFLSVVVVCAVAFIVIDLTLVCVDAVAVQHCSLLIWKLYSKEILETLSSSLCSKTDPDQTTSLGTLPQLPSKKKTKI